MDYLDFFSDSPKTYIFQKEANKTKFGGILFIIYIIIMCFISLAYILDYINNSKYIVEYSRYLNSSFSMKDKTYFHQEEEEISFKFNILSNDKQNITEDEFEIIYNYAPISRNTFVKSNLSDFILKIYYKCQNKECEQKYPFMLYYLNIEYNGFELYHQNDTFPPLQKNENKYFTYRTRFNIDYPSSIYLKWESVKYIEEKGVPKIFNSLETKKDEYISGYISSSSSTLHEKNWANSERDTDLKLIAVVYLENSDMGYVQYKRKRIGILDVLSKIGALFSTIRVFFLFFFKYYSNNFNNYKVIEKILISNNNYSYKQIELSGNLQNSKNVINIENNNKTDNKINAPLINDISDEKKLTINDDTKYEDYDNEDEEKPLKELPKFSFFDYYYNKIYFKSCYKNEKQEIINLYNEILLKYFSVDTILYNQIMLENLFKDYHWNNPSLNNIEKNQLIIRLKKMINS